MITKISDHQINRLLLKIASYIGPACLQFVSLLLDANVLSRIELELLERNLTMDFYPDEIIEEASECAMERGVSSIVQFNFIIMEVDRKYLNFVE